jgi:hypothetical protein
MLKTTLSGPTMLAFASAFPVPPFENFGSLPECSRSPWEQYPLALGCPEKTGQKWRNNMYQLKSKSSASFHIIEELIKHLVHGKDKKTSLERFTTYVSTTCWLARSSSFALSFRSSPSGICGALWARITFGLSFSIQNQPRNQPGWLFLKDQRRPANALTLEVDPYFDAVRNLY